MQHLIKKVRQITGANWYNSFEKTFIQATDKESALGKP